MILPFWYFEKISCHKIFEKKKKGIARAWEIAGEVQGRRG